MKMRAALSITSAALLLTLSAAPAAYADPAMNACIDAFVAEHALTDRKLKIRRVGSFNAASSATREERITLTAKGARSGTPLAAATCIVSGDGSVTLQEADASTTVAANAR